MDNKSLILLGFLIVLPQHGYQINEFIEKNLSTLTDMKKPTAYATLDKLSKNGYIDVQLEQEGNRPPRKVFSINQKGKDYFYELLLENLSLSENFYYEGDIGIIFIDHLPIEQVIPALSKKLEGERKILESLAEVPHHSNGIGVNLAVAHKKCMMEAEVNFLETLLKSLVEKQNKNN